MNEETGTVIGTSEDGVLVKIDRDAKCAGCHSCFVDERDGALLTMAPDPLHVQVGDRVRLEESEAPGRRTGSGMAGLLLFGLPLLAFVPGYIGGQALGRLLGLGSPESLGVPGGLVGFALPLLVLWLRSRRKGKREKPGLRIVDVLREGVGHGHPEIGR